MSQVGSLAAQVFDNFYVAQRRVCLNHGDDTGTGRLNRCRRCGCTTTTTFIFMRHSHMLSQTVLIFERFFTFVTLNFRLIGVLGANMSPKVCRRNDQLAKLALGPFTIYIWGGCGGIWKKIQQQQEAMERVEESGGGFFFGGER